MYKAKLLPIAKLDIREAAFWYNEKLPGLGKRFTSEVREKTSFILKDPKASTTRYLNVRTAVLNKFPFMIHYTVDEANLIVLISAVLHTSRNPEIWETRK